MTIALVAVTASQGRVTRTDRGWVPVGDPMEAAIDTFA